MSIMGLKGLKNNPSRNGFDLSGKRNFTAKAGELLPPWWRYTYLGDKFDIDAAGITRTCPINTAAYARMTEYYDFYYVPFSQLWNKSNNVLQQLNYEQSHATGLGASLQPYNGELPYLTTEQIGTYITNVSNSANEWIKSNFFGYDRAELSCKLLEYLLYGNYSLYAAPNPSTKLPYNLDQCIFPLLAYQKIYADWFRNQQWEQVNPSSFNIDYMSGVDTMNMDLPTGGSPFYNYGNFFDLRYCNWQMDLYHGLLPSAQYGETSVVPLGPSSEQVVDFIGVDVVDRGVLPGFAASDSDSPYTLGAYGNNVQQGDTSFALGANTAKGSYPVGFHGVLKSSSNISQGLSILALRQYEFLQKWKEIAQAGDQNYKAMSERIWGVKVPELLSGKARWIGGFSNNIGINEVVNTNINANQGADIAGKGYGAMNGTIHFENPGEPGIVMCIYHVVPLVDYTCDYISPELLMVNAEDFPNPVFDRIGMESVSTASIMNDSKAAIPVGSAYKTPYSLGYAPRYINAKTDIDLSLGGFKRDLSSWVVAYGYDDMAQGLDYVGSDNPVVPAPEQSVNQDGQGNNYAFMKVNPNMLDPIMSLEADSSVNSDQFWISAMFKVSAVRNFDRDGLPY